MGHEYRAGLHNVGSYQISGIPYVTASLAIPGTGSAPLELIFPSVTQKITIHNHHATIDLKAGISALGVAANNYWLIDHEDPNGKGTSYIELRIKTDRVFLQAAAGALTGAFVYAELTGIKVDYDLAAAYSGSDGIG